MSNPDSSINPSSPSLTPSDHLDNAASLLAPANVAPTAPDDASAAQPVAGPDSLLLSVKCPSLPHDPSPLAVGRSWSVKEIKELIERSWVGRPKAEGMRIIRSGRILGDDEKVDRVFDKSDDTPTIHLVIRPDAWTQPRPTSAAPSTNDKAPSDPSPSLSRSEFSTYFQSPASPGWPAYTHEASISGSSAPAGGGISASALGGRGLESGSFGGFHSWHPALEAAQPPPHLLAAFSTRLASTPSTDFDDLHTLLESAYAFYWQRYDRAWRAEYGSSRAPAPVDRSAGSVGTDAALGSGDDRLSEGEVKKLMTSLGVSHGLDDSAEGESPAGSFTYQQTMINGLPYVVSVPAPTSSQRRLHNMFQQLVLTRHMAAMTRGAALRLQIGSANRIMGTPFLPNGGIPGGPGRDPLQAFADAAAQAGGDPGGANGGLGERNDNQLGGGARGAADGGALYLIIDLTSLLSIALPLLFLSFKLGILVYVFARQASPLKRAVMITASVFYVVWEGYSLLQRRRRMRDAQERVRRAAAEGVAGARARRQGDVGTPVAAGAGGGGTEGRRQQRTQSGAATSAHLTNYFSFDYWLDVVSYIGLEEEAAELGLPGPRATSTTMRNGRPVPDNGAQSPPPSPAQNPAAEQEQRRNDVGGRGSGAYRALEDHLFIPLILFVATLFPEVEQRRRRALKDRERKLRERARKEQREVEERERKEKEREEQERREREAPTEPASRAETEEVNFGAGPSGAQTQAVSGTATTEERTEERTTNVQGDSTSALGSSSDSQLRQRHLSRLVDDAPSVNTVQVSPDGDAQPASTSSANVARAEAASASGPPDTGGSTNGERDGGDGDLGSDTDVEEEGGLDHVDGEGRGEVVEEDGDEDLFGFGEADEGIDFIF